ncbi:MAG: hypothetical protein WAN43_13860 [Rhodomicrobium sp.]
MAIAAANLPCRAFVDGLGVKIDDETVFEPDALVNCGPPMRRGSLIAPNQVIVVEVISPTSARRVHQLFPPYGRAALSDRGYGGPELRLGRRGAGKDFSRLG